MSEWYWAIVSVSGRKPKSKNGEVEIKG